MDRQTVSTGTFFEEEFGYSRAIRMGSHIRVSGTTAYREGEVVCAGDAYGQTSYILETIAAALEDLGASMDDVLITRMFVRDFDDWEEIGRAHKEFLGDVLPATTLIEISDFPDEGILLEIEAEAVTQ